jgi:hypothetical protein
MHVQSTPSLSESCLTVSNISLHSFAQKARIII